MQRWVHYEIFVRASPKAGWTLRFADEDRALVIKTAEDMLASAAVVAIRVSREQFDSETREYKSLTILEKGATKRGGRERAAPEAVPLCVTPSDLYSTHARDRIGRLFESWLKRHRATPFELLHRADLAERLQSSTLEVQHAIQKISIPEAQARGVGVHVVMREFRGLAERAFSRLEKDAERAAFRTIDLASFSAAASAAAQAPEGGYSLGGSVATHLAGAGWAEKVDRLLDLADALPEEAAARAFAMAVIEQPLAEILSTWGAPEDLFGPELDLGGGLLALTRLAAPREIAALIRADPALGPLIPPLPPTAERLAAWMAREPSEALRAALAGRVLRELTSPRPLCPSSPEGEIAVLRVLALAITAATGRLLAAEEVRAAFLDRSRMIVSSAFVEDYLAGRDSALAEARALLYLAENVVGTAHRLTAARFVAGCVCSLRFERELRGDAEGVAAKLAGLADLHRAVLAAGLPPAEAASILGKLAELGGLVEADARLTATLARAPAPSPQRLLALFRLMDGQAAPPGPVAERARAEIMRLAADPAVRTELSTADPATVETLLARLQSLRAATEPRRAA